MSRAAWLVLALLASLFVGGCGGDTSDDASYSSDTPPLSIYAQTTSDTAVGETLMLGVFLGFTNSYGVQNEDDAYDCTFSATCQGTSCHAETTRDGEDVQVTSAVAETVVVQVTAVANDNHQTYTASFPVVFRAATKIAILRAMSTSPAGNAFAMPAGDTQTWYFVAADDQGILDAPPEHFNVESDQPSDLQCAPTLSSSEEPTITAFACTIGSETPETITLTARWKAFARTETVRIVPFSDAVDATLMTCDAPAIYDALPPYVPIEETDVPCTPVTQPLDYDATECTAAAPSIALTVLLTLKDGTKALGGARYLSCGTLDSTDGTTAVPSGVGTITGRFGEGVVSVPYDINEACTP